jgi:hypothetical protein
VLYDTSNNGHTILFPLKKSIAHLITRSPSFFAMTQKKVRCDVNKFKKVPLKTDNAFLHSEEYASDKFAK